MYWRVRTITPEQLARMYGVHVALAVSLLVNVGLFFTRPDPKKLVNTQIKTDFDHFARIITTQLLDNSFISYEQSTTALLTGQELTGNVIQQLKADGTLPKSVDEVKATAQSLEEQKTVSSVRIDAVNQGEPNAQGMIPVRVQGLLVIHNASGCEDPKPFTFQYLMGQAGRPDDPSSMKPIVTGLSAQ